MNNKYKYQYMVAKLWNYYKSSDKLNKWRVQLIKAYIQARIQGQHCD